MRIMVFDVPAVSGGALTILIQYYEKARKNENEKNIFYFVLSKPFFEETSNVKVLRFPWIKKSWLHRWCFDTFVAHKLVKKYEIDEILSLQNLLIPRAKVKQILYLHQTLPFTEKKFKFTENYKLWIYQNIIGKKIIRSVKKAEIVIVQTIWMKNACVKLVGLTPDKIKVCVPKVNISEPKQFSQCSDSDTMFFYPANAAMYKNHTVVVDAAFKLKQKGIENFKVVFTLKGDENKGINELVGKAKVNDLYIDFVGPLTLERVYEYYSKSVLVFPSYIETFGLPMLEAKIHGCPIIASDCLFSHEILDEYDKTCFFNPFSSDELASCMAKLI